MNRATFQRQLPHNDWLKRAVPVEAKAKYRSASFFARGLRHSYLKCELYNVAHADSISNA